MSVLRLVLLVVLAVLAASATVVPATASAQQACADSPTGQACGGLEEPECEPPECADPGVTAWPNPVSQSEACANHYAEQGGSCDHLTATATLNGQGVANASAPPPWNASEAQWQAYCTTVGSLAGCDSELEDYGRRQTDQIYPVLEKVYELYP